VDALGNITLGSIPPLNTLGNFDFAQASPFDWIMMLNQLGDWIGSFRESSLFGTFAAVGAGDGDIYSARIFFCGCHEFLERSGREFGVRHQRRTRGHKLADRHEIFQGIVRKLLVEARVHHHGADIADEERVAVGRRFCGDFRRENAVHALAVIDHHVLAERFAQLRRDEARGEIRRSARCRRHEQPHRTFPMLLRRRRHNTAYGGSAHKNHNSHRF